MSVEDPPLRSSGIGRAGAHTDVIDKVRFGPMRAQAIRGDGSNPQRAESGWRWSGKGKNV